MCSLTVTPEVAGSSPVGPASFQKRSTLSMDFYVYIIYSQSRDRYYIGYSHDLSLRLIHHNDGWTKSTKSGIPWKLVHSEKYKSRAEALNREKEIKRMKSRTYIEELIRLP